MFSQALVGFVFFFLDLAFLNFSSFFLSFEVGVQWEKKSRTYFHAQNRV